MLASDSVKLVAESEKVYVLLYGIRIQLLSCRENKHLSRLRLKLVKTTRKDRIDLRGQYEAGNSILFISGASTRLTTKESPYQTGHRHGHSSSTCDLKTLTVAEMDKS